ncbi:LIC_10190 family membrane protein [Hymenobacter sp. B81]|uniref:LIC_10190 family membrane protein n=1 Tax=Hymenobacter sp. B81 TaxID=3344878 RepID=UPI0037DDB984
MLAVFLLWLLTSAATLVLGRAGYVAAGRLGLLDARSAPAPEWLCVLGLSLLTAALQLVSLVMPVNNSLRLGLLAAVLALGWAQRRALAALLYAQWPRQLRDWVAAAALGWLLGCLLLLTSMPLVNPDTGLYHLQAIQWNQLYPVVPGLGNVHGRLAFNSSWFLTEALLPLPTPAGAAYCLSSYWLALLAAVGVRSVARAAPGARLVAAAPLLLLVLLLTYFRTWVSSPSPDFVVTVLLLLIFWLLARPGKAAGTAAAEQENVLVGLVLGLVAVSVKLSVLPVLLLPTLLLLRRPQPRQLLAAGALAGLVLGPWLGRNALLSGYLVYPLPALDWLSVDWKIPRELVQAEYNVIVNMARQVSRAAAAGPVGDWGGAWWQPWWRAQTAFNQVLLGAVAVSPLVAAGAGWQRRRAELPAARRWLLGWAVALLGGAFWLASAPDVRFGLGFLLLAALWPWLALAQTAASAAVSRWLARGLLLLLLLWSVNEWRDPLYQLRHQPAAFARRLGWPDAGPAAATRTVPVPGGVLRVPQRGAQCWSAPVPCSYHVPAGLQWRGPSAGDGFRIR